MAKEMYTFQASAWAKTDETRFIYDGWDMIRELDANMHSVGTALGAGLAS